MDEETFRSILESQREVGIVRARRPLRFPEVPEQLEPSSEDRRMRYRGERQEKNGEEVTNNEIEHFVTRHSVDASAPYFHEIQYSTSSSQPDLFVEDGGFIKVVDFQKLPSLVHIGFSVVRTSLREVIILYALETMGTLNPIIPLKQRDFHAILSFRQALMVCHR